MATENKRSFLKYFSTWRIIIPIALGLSISGYLIGKSFDVRVFQQLDWGAKSILWIFLAVVFLLLRDLMNMLRLRHLTHKKLGLKQLFQSIVLWEFGTSVMPSFIGGSAMALIVVHKEGVELGRTTAVVMLSSLLDELYFILLIPIAFALLSFTNIFGFTLNEMPFSSGWIFWGGYIYLAFLALFITTSVFIFPHLFGKVVRYIFRLKLIRRWKGRANRMSRDLITSSRELKGQPIAYWLKAFLFTFLAWTARFFIINCLVMAFMPGVDHAQLYVRQLLMWVVMLVSPTPGASGIAEWIFSDYLGVFLIAGLAPVLALIWRLLTFYYYLVAGSLVLPVWVRRVFK